MLVPAAADLFAYGDLAGGMRNLWNIHCLSEQFGTDGLAERARHHGLEREVHRAARLAHALYATAIPEAWRTRDRADALFRRRLTARDGWGRPTRTPLRPGFYLPPPWPRLPPATPFRRDPCTESCSQDG